MNPDFSGCVCLLHISTLNECSPVKSFGHLTLLSCLYVIRGKTNGSGIKIKLILSLSFGTI